jgi:hypothetical protein
VHQFGVKEEKCTANMSYQVRGVNSHSKWEWADKRSSNSWIAKEEVEKETNQMQQAGNE